MRRLLALGFLLSGCYRPTDSYEVRVYGQGTALDDVLPEAPVLGGLVEVSRVHLWGTNLGLAAFGGGDIPRSDGLSFVLPYAAFGYPANTSWARGSYAFPPGPDPSDAAECVTLVGVDYSPGPSSEYVDVGDRVELVGPEGETMRMLRDPAAHPRPAGESWYVAYGGLPIASVLPGHPNLTPTFWPDATASVRFPGAIQAPEATIGAIPAPVEGSLAFPEPIAGLTVNGAPVRAPRHGYDEDGVFVGEDQVDDVRFLGPWNEGGTAIAWEPSASAQAVSVSVRLLASGFETPCDGCSDCEPGFRCEAEDAEDPESVSWCAPDEGSSWLSVGEITCTVPDTGAFTLTAEHLELLLLSVPPYYVDGAVLTVGRRLEGTMSVPDALTYNGKRAPLLGVRTRTSDTIVTRLDAPPPLPGQDEDGEPLP